MESLQGQRSSQQEPATRSVAILGATGSVGRSALDVIAHEGGDRLTAFGLSGHRNVKLLVEQARQFRPRYVAVTDPEAAVAVRGELCDLPTEVLVGDDGLIAMVRHPEVDLVLSAIVGAAGLNGTWAAIEAGKTIALANKETLVVAGPLVMELARQRGVEILPVDSEHAAIHQALASGRDDEVQRVILTSSGGPFRGKTRSELAAVTVAEALKHPTWAMGPKISIDSSTLMNKALEIIEARWLFDLKPEQIEVVVHPQSIIHSMVEFRDGSVMAQLSPPDMRLPIQYALTYPDRVAGPSPRLDITARFSMEFEPPDLVTFPALELGFEVLRAGGTAGAALNAANEAAVARFLEGTLAYLEIPRACRAAVEAHHYEPRPSLQALRQVDHHARREIACWRSSSSSCPS